MAGRESGPDLTGGLFDKEKLFDKPEPLAGVRILEVCYVVLGPATCDYLGEFGAEVIKFEGRKGDQMRFVTPYAYFWKKMSPGLEIENHNKYWVGMHVGNPKAKEFFLELVKKSDVVVGQPHPRPHGGVGPGLQGPPGSEPAHHPTARFRLRQLGALDGQNVL